MRGSGLCITEGFEDLWEAMRDYSVKFNLHINQERGV